VHVRAGQIEVFTWSASGQIITESLASAFATCLVYVVDTPRTASPTTFMSNMLYACSILYRTRLPMVLAFNKSDVTSPDFAAGESAHTCFAAIRCPCVLLLWGWRHLWRGAAVEAKAPACLCRARRWWDGAAC
jgi:Conserved hypothetical ATP binding protein